MATAKGIILLVGRVVLAVLLILQLVALTMWTIEIVKNGNLTANSYQPLIRLVLYVFIAIVDVYGILGAWFADAAYLMNFAVAMGAVLIAMVALHLTLGINQAEIIDGIGLDVVRIVLAIICFWMIRQGWTAVRVL